MKNLSLMVIDHVCENSVRSPGGQKGCKLIRSEAIPPLDTSSAHTVRHLLCHDPSNIREYINQNRTQNTGNRPRSKQTAVNCADLDVSEQILQVSWNSGEPSTVHAQDDYAHGHEE